MLTKKQVEEIEDRACPWGEAMWNEDGQCVFLADKCSKEEAVKVANYYNELEDNDKLASKVEDVQCYKVRRKKATELDIWNSGLEIDVGEYFWYLVDKYGKKVWVVD